MLQGSGREPGTGSELLSSGQETLEALGTGRSERGRSDELGLAVCLGSSRCCGEPDRHQQTHASSQYCMLQFEGTQLHVRSTKTPHLSHVILMLSLEDNLYL